MRHKSKTEYQTFWLVNGVRIDAYHTMEQRVLAGAIAIEVSAESQQVEAEQRKQRARENAILDARIREAALARQHENSLHGQREAALRTAAANPGGIVSGAPSSNFAELDQFGRDHNNPFK
jgi:hypothetical protein